MDWTELRRFREPFTPAAFVLIAHGGGYRDLLIRATAVSPDGDSVTLTGGQTNIDVRARRHLVAQRHVADAGAKRPGHALLSRHGGAIHPNIAVHAVRTVAYQMVSMSRAQTEARRAG